MHAMRLLLSVGVALRHIHVFATMTHEKQVRKGRISSANLA